MSTISQIELPSGSVYDLEDSAARADIENLKTTAIGGVYFRGNVKEALTDGATTSPVTIVSTNAEGSSIETSLTPAAGDIVNVGGIFGELLVNTKPLLTRIMHLALLHLQVLYHSRHLLERKRRFLQLIHPLVALLLLRTFS